MDNDHLELTVQRMAELHAAHVGAQSPLQRRVEKFTRAIGDPRTISLVVAGVVGWMLLNAIASALRWRAWDAPPFQFLELVATVVALITTLMILATQAREEEAARHRAQLTLQLASLSEQKIAKVIRLLEEQRQDSSALPNRKDREAEEMAQAADPKHVMERIRDTHEGQDSAPQDIPPE